MDNVANIVWNDEQERYELFIGGEIKAYTMGEVVDGEALNTMEGHATGKKEMAEMVEKKGYTVKEG